MERIHYASKNHPIVASNLPTGTHPKLPLIQTKTVQQNSGRTPKKVPQSSKCIKSPDAKFKDKAATILPVRRKCERFLLDIFSSRRNRLFQLQFVICLLRLPLCVHAFDKSLSKCKPTQFQQDSDMSSANPNSKSVFMPSCDMYLFPVNTPRKEFHTWSETVLDPQFCRTPPRSYNRQQDPPSFSHIPSNTGIEKGMPHVVGHHVAPSRVTVLFYERKTNKK